MSAPTHRTRSPHEKGGAVRLLSLISLFLLLSGGTAGAVIRDLKDLSQDPLSYVDRKSGGCPFSFRRRSWRV